MPTTPLPADFFARDASTVAMALLGCLLVHHDGQLEGEPVVRIGRIVETEAYLGPHDLAAHSAKGRTPRTQVMFGPPAHAYVYLIYGMYELFNVVTGNNNGQAVLIRALEPIQNLCYASDGPGKLSKAMGINRRHNRQPLTAAPLYISAASRPVRHLWCGARIGVDYAKAWAQVPLRFVDAQSAHLSRNIRHKAS